MSAREELVAEITDVLNAAISESEYDTEWAESVVGCLLNAHPARLLRAMAEMSWLTDDAAEVDRLRSVLAVRDQQLEDARALLTRARNCAAVERWLNLEAALDAFLAGLDMQPIVYTGPTSAAGGVQSREPLAGLDVQEAGQ